MCTLYIWIFDCILIRITMYVCSVFTSSPYIERSYIHKIPASRLFCVSMRVQKTTLLVWTYIGIGPVLLSCCHCFGMIVTFLHVCDTNTKMNYKHRYKYFRKILSVLNETCQCVQPIHGKHWLREKWICENRNETKHKNISWVFQ